MAMRVVYPFPQFDIELSLSLGTLDPDPAAQVSLDAKLQHSGQALNSFSDLCLYFLGNFIKNSTFPCVLEGGCHGQQGTADPSQGSVRMPRWVPSKIPGFNLLPIFWSLWVKI
jgi:hypothetical protein